jgi:hypothetical protein
LAAAALLAAACSGDGSGAPLPTTTSTDPSVTVTTLVRTGGPLVVVDQGFVSFPDPYASGQSLAGYGVVLQNPDPALLAAGVNVTTRFLGADGAELLVDRALLNGVMPGRTMAVGRTIVEHIATPAQLVVTVEVDAWIPPVLAADSLEVTEGVTEPEVYGGAVTRFAITSSAGSDEDSLDVAAVYRDGAGALLAVETTQVDQLPPGEVVVGQIRLLAPIPGLASTEVLVGRGLAAQVSG